MVRLIDIQRQTEQLSQEEREGLVAYLIHGLGGIPQGPDDDEVDRREVEMDSGNVRPIRHAEFLAQVGRHNS
jgi:hypothetical protein